VNAAADQTAVPRRAVAPAGTGWALEPAVRTEMEQRFGADFSGVRVHTDASAARSAMALRSRAYTIGQDVVFGPGRYAPGTTAGRQLLAHELAHTIQQRNQQRNVQPGSSLPVSSPADAAEREASHAAASGGAVSISQTQNTIGRDDAPVEDEEGPFRLQWPSGLGPRPRPEPTWRLPAPELFPPPRFGPSTWGLPPQGKLQLGPITPPSPGSVTVTPPGPRVTGTGTFGKTVPAGYDETAKRLGAKDYRDYETSILKGGSTIFGKSIPAANPVHPRFLDKLERASAQAEIALAGASFDINVIAGHDRTGGLHGWGMAIDIDSGRNPYISREFRAGGVQEKEVDALVNPVYERIARRMLNRRSVIVHDVTTIAREQGLVGPKAQPGHDLEYELLAQENDAMVAYFAALRTTPSPAKQMARAAMPAPTTTADKDIDQIRKDFETLRGKGDRTGVPKGHDFPFEGGGAERSPHRGFLSIRREIVNAMRAQGLRWGALDFSGARGDVMHFDDGTPAGGIKPEYFTAAASTTPGGGQQP
jgi:hypothetical protein